ncbi:MAG TPA: hypothetical protein VH601_22930 [Bryobacteraceae bacterium]
MTRKITHMILSAALSALLGTARLGGQSLREVADIPFTFHAQQQTLPAGTYQVNEMGSNGVFQLIGPNRESIFVGPMAPAGANPEKAHLTFACFGKERVLAEIAMPGKGTAYHATRSQIEKNLAHKIGLATMISVPLNGR